MQPRALLRRTAMTGAGALLVTSLAAGAAQAGPVAPQSVAPTVPTAMSLVSALSAESTESLVYSRLTRNVYLSTASGHKTPGPAVTFGRQNPLQKGRYLVELDMTVQHTSPDSIDYVSASVGCGDKVYRLSDQMVQSSNTFRGHSAHLTPRMVFTVKGKGSCWGGARAMRIFGSGTVVRHLKVTSAQLRILGPLPEGALTTQRAPLQDRTGSIRDFYGTSTLVRPGGTKSFGAVKTRVAPRTRYVDVRSNLMMTSCISTGGSNDDTTNGRQLCRGHVTTRPHGVRVITSVQLVQLAKDGVTPCHRYVVPGSVIKQDILDLVHHEPRSTAGVITLDPACGKTLKASLKVSVRDRVYVMVHYPATSVTVVPLRG